MALALIASVLHAQTTLPVKTSVSPHTTLAAGTGASLPTFTLVTGQISTANSSDTCTLPSNITAGNIVMVGGAENVSSGYTVSSVKDGNGVSLTVANTISNSTYSVLGWVAYTLSAGGGTNSIVVTYSTATTSSYGACAEFKATGGTPVFDTSATGTSATTTNPVATLTAASAGELAFAWHYLNGTATAAGTPWTGIGFPAGNCGEYNLSAPSTITTSCTPTGMGGGVALVEAIK
jgi:hypothetical protein